MSNSPFNSWNWSCFWAEFQGVGTIPGRRVAAVSQGRFEVDDTGNQSPSRHLSSLPTPLRNPTTVSPTAMHTHDWLSVWVWHTHTHTHTHLWHHADMTFQELLRSTVETQMMFYTEIQQSEPLLPVASSWKPLCPDNLKPVSENTTLYIQNSLNIYPHRLNQLIHHQVCTSISTEASWAAECFLALNTENGYEVLIKCLLTLIRLSRC